MNEETDLDLSLQRAGERWRESLPEMHDPYPSFRRGATGRPHRSSLLGLAAGVAVLAVLAVTVVLAFLAKPTDPRVGLSVASPTANSAAAATPTKSTVLATPTPAAVATRTPAAVATEPGSSPTPPTPLPHDAVAQFANPDGPDPDDYPPDGYPFFETAYALPTFARLWIDDNQRDVHLALTGDIDGAIAEIRDAVPRGITVYFHIVEYSQAELCALRDAMFDDRDELMRHGLILTSGGCGNAMNRVNVGMSPLTPEAIAYMRARFDGPIHYERGGASELRPYDPPQLNAPELVAIREGEDTGLLTCGRRPFPAEALHSPPGDLNRTGPEYGALRDALSIYVDLYGDLTQLGWILAESDEYGATFIADRGDTWLEAPVFAGIEGWIPGTIDYCSPRRLTAHDGGMASVYLDPAFPKPKAGATEIHVLVTEEGCAGGRSPAGRLLPPTVRYDDDSVTITVRIRSVGGLARCPTNPRLPVTIELPEPLGDRILAGITAPPEH